MGREKKNQEGGITMRRWKLEREGHRWVVRPYWAMPFIPLYKVRIVEFWLKRAEYPIRPYRLKDGREVPAYGIETLEWDGWLVKIARAISSLVDKGTAKIKAITHKQDPEDIPF